MKIFEEHGRLVVKSKGEILWIEPWGESGIRVRGSQSGKMDSRDWALSEKPSGSFGTIKIYPIRVVEPWAEKDPDRILYTEEADIENGWIRVHVNFEGRLSFFNRDGKLLLEEYYRDRHRVDRFAVPQKIKAREMKAVPGTSDYSLVARFEANENEQIYGMGQYQEKYLDKKGSIVELAQRNTQISIPFFLSSKGYGFLWNNPAVGTAVFGENRTEWTALRTGKLDYYITAEQTPARILYQYTDAVGRAPSMPEFALGFWQSKLRYRNQEELLQVAKKMKSLGIPLRVLVIDFFHWTTQGDFRMDPLDWPDPEKMIRELRQYGVETMVSVWPTCDRESENRGEMEENGYLVKTDRGIPAHMNWMGETAFVDFFHPDARTFVWELCKKNYYDLGIRSFWLDEAEPEFDTYDLDVYRYHAGPALEVSNLYPLEFSKTFWDGLKEEDQKEVVNLVRCAWVGSQKYGALVWSGDVHSSFRALREQIQAGLSIGIAGIPWWTTDVGGFLGGYPKDEEFKELLIRWFQFSAFSPVLRMHGARQPFLPLEEPYRNGIKQFTSGQDNEIWSYGEEAFKIMKDYILLRERLIPYLKECMEESSVTGLPVMRAMFLSYPDQKESWSHETQYMLGNDLLVAPVACYRERNRQVWLPAGESWTCIWDGKSCEGGAVIDVEAPLERIPVFSRNSTFMI